MFSDGIVTGKVSSAPHQHQPGYTLLRVIGAFKLVKSLSLIAAAMGALKLMKGDKENELVGWARRLHIAPGNHYLQALVMKALSISQEEWKVLAAVLLVYAAMFMVEGIGLLLMQHWAEWMTIITTSGLIPLEIYELCLRPTATKTIALIINIAVVVYLVIRLRADRSHKKDVATKPS